MTNLVCKSGDQYDSTDCVCCQMWSAEVAHLQRIIDGFANRIAAQGDLLSKRAEGADRPRRVCLCGSTRFKQQFIEANYRETMAGRIVLSVGWFSHADAHVYSPTEQGKAALDDLHLRKIDLADEVLVINPNARCCDKCGKPCDLDDIYAHERGYLTRSRCCEAHWRCSPYVGDSTRREIAYAQSLGKPVRYLVPMEAL